MAKKEERLPHERKPDFQIIAPVGNFKGERGGLKFVEGVATTSDATLANWFMGLGYKVVPLPE